MIPQSAAERHRKVKVFTAAGRFPAENDCRPAFSARPDKFLLFSAGISCKMEAVTKKKGGGDMASCLVQMGDGSVTLPGAAVRALLQKGDGDAALLYLALLRHSGAVPPRSLAGELRWERERIEQAERALREMKLIAPTAEELPAPAEEKPDYTAEEITDQLEHSAGFRELTAQVERRLGKKLSTPDVSALLGLYDYMGKKKESPLAAYKSSKKSAAPSGCSGALCSTRSALSPSCRSRKTAAAPHTASGASRRTCRRTFKKPPPPQMPSFLSE